jgi:hypothetical protein
MVIHTLSHTSRDFRRAQPPFDAAHAHVTNFMFVVGMFDLRLPAHKPERASISAPQWWLGQEFTPYSVGVVKFTPQLSVTHMADMCIPSINGQVIFHFSVILLPTWNTMINFSRIHIIVQKCQTL